MNSGKLIFQKLRHAFRRVFIRSVAYFILLVVSLAAIMAFMNYHEEMGEVERRLARAGEGHANLIAALAPTEIAEKRHGRLEQILKAVVAEAHVIGAVIYSNSGHVIAEETGSIWSLVAEAPDSDMFSAAMAGEAAVYDSEAAISYLVLITNNHAVVGSVQVSMSKDEIEVIRQEILDQVLILFGILFFIFVPVGTYMMYRSTHGISGVTKAANEAAQGYLDTEIPVDTPGEVGELQEAFRAMSVSLRNTIKRIETLAHFDNVTGLPNRLKFENAAKQIIDLSPNAEGALLFIDLDRFKEINDMHGYALGDELLKLASTRLKSLVMETFSSSGKARPFLAQFANDEFAVILPGVTDAEKLLEFSYVIVDTLSQPIRIDPLSLIVGASVGIALYPQDGASSDEVLRSADMAMYSAKKKGCERVSIFEERIRETALERREMEHHLMSALENGEFAVFYQPKLDLASGRIMGSEALLRWRSPELGNVPRHKFIPLAENCGLMGGIGEFVLRQSLADMKGLVEQGHDISVAVNVAPVQFESAHFTDRALGILGESGFPLDRLELEITESSVMDDPERVMKQVAPIKDEGVKLAIDDFGTGYSSLSTLATMPFDTLKIDRAFVCEMDVNEDRRAIVQLILMMAAQLRMKTVAEGIETPLQFEQLRAWGASYAQGYLWSPPVDFEKFTEMIKSDFRFDVTPEISGQTRQRQA